MGTNRQTVSGARTVETDVVDAAKARVEHERGVIDAERDAFAQFRKRVDRLAPDGAKSRESVTPSRSAARATMLDGSESTGQSALAAVRDAYRETVMATAHYDADYGDTYAESLAAEFGPELAHGLIGDGGFPAILRERLLAAVDSAVENRQRVRATLDREHRALTRAGETLAELREEVAAIDSRPFFDCDPDELRRLRADLTALDRQCDQLAASRQSGDLHTATTLPHANDHCSLSDLLYDDLDVQFPVLSATATTSERIHDARTRVERALTATRTTERRHTA
ncbi:DUF7260 family protein [Halocalculus aciditolerans]|uniref:DUF7260 domain-containing protein n=1 Tax=Halocalculus aciditolerans TaxID=1383812 RepID=A0A830FL21_9EURY|nr:hypothetical protein [Halocalculus aciditolerans]GGL66337.1 hypothetical protein GCM10009039_25350 [Halocalculus aciditolerans]